MYVMKITNDYESFFSSTETSFEENDDNFIILKSLLLSIPSSLLLLSFISLIIYTLLKPLITTEYLDKFLYPLHPVRCNITELSKFDKPYFLMNIKINTIFEFEKNHLKSKMCMKNHSNVLVTRYQELKSQNNSLKNNWTQYLMIQLRRKTLKNQKHT